MESARKDIQNHLSVQRTIAENGFVVYRRQNNNMTYRINDFDVDNRCVVPYNRDLIVRYDSQINIEWCAHSKVIKYLYKYIHMGSDRATIVIDDNIVQPNNNGECMYRCVNEIKQFQDGRYISLIEACWSILEFYLQKQYPSV